MKGAGGMVKIFHTYNGLQKQNKATYNVEKIIFQQSVSGLTAKNRLIYLQLNK